MATLSPPQDPSDSRKAFDLADAWAKQISTLATGTIVLSATFIKDILPEGSQIEWKWLLYASWFVLLISAVLGLVVLGALTSHLSHSRDGRLDVYASSIRLSALAQFGTFFGGIGLFALFAAINL